MESAEMTGETQAQGTAPAQEPSIPKHRFDEVLAQLKAARETSDIQAQLLNQMKPQPQSQGPQLPKIEDLGLEPQVAQAVGRFVAQYTDARLQAVEPQIQGAFANLNNQLEETRFLLNHGKDKAKYADKIKEQRMKHHRMTGSYQSVEDAYKIVAYDEMVAAQTRRAATPPQTVNEPTQATSTQAQAAPAEEVVLPNATRTHVAQTQSGKAKGFDEMTLDEKEAYLERIQGDLAI